ncbi:GH116 family glycosyl-hydrolase, partial [Pontiellaceae bacterium B12219]|nr:GH116 family glycosyl-hydrolase [Pontiellaceae bacterium B12219]
MTFGSVARKDARAANIEIDEFAHYGDGLSLTEVREHLEAGGWSRQLEQYGREVETYQGKLAIVRERKRKAIMNDPALTARGESTVYQGENLTAVSFMVGGIGAGAVQYNGSAEPAIWQIACNHDQIKIDDSFLAIRAQPKGGKPVVRALQTKSVGPFAAMKSLEFIGEYPIATYRFEEPALPVEVELELFNPFTPMDLKSSAIPCMVSTVNVTNRSDAPVNVDLLAAQKNIVGYTSGATGSKPAYGQNRNHILRKGNATLLHMTKDGEGQGAGMDMVLMTRAEDATGLALWDSQETLYDTFSKDGKLDGADAAGPSSDKQTMNGALSVPLELAPGQSESVVFVLTWFMPKAEHGQTETWTHEGNMYANWWPNAMAVA